ncbi:hypothetical protein RvY_14943 [Ramazzottius varieornatus]|uniref:Uncharacterized protein n=1 Tax=Ramazzottius varieornatus TaxID=947166 RepID=A0A1D1W1E2_RAMVA|nr:hypothetical protein RvY_14943 [Ramazzottius varieornatus]
MKVLREIEMKDLSSDKTGCWAAPTPCFYTVFHLIHSSLIAIRFITDEVLYLALLESETQGPTVD